MVSVRSPKELELMRKSGQITAKALKKAINSVKPGITLMELDKIAEDEIKRLGGQASFKTVSGYNWTTCLTVNDEVVHGIPREIILKEGDVLGIDLGAVYQGWHTDSSWSVIVGRSANNKENFLKVGEEALWEGVNKAIAGNRVGDISAAIEKVIKKAGFSPAKNYSGHGVGRSPHEEPTIPCYGTSGTGPVLKAGMTLAIEAIYTEGSDVLIEKDDGWTVASSDGSLGGLFEMSVVVGEKKAEILTDWRKV